MEIVVPGLIKIGKTASENFEQHMRYLERNGYNNVTGLKRHFAIKVEEYDEKEIMLTVSETLNKKNGRPLYFWSATIFIFCN